MCFALLTSEMCNLVQVKDDRTFLRQRDPILECGQKHVSVGCVGRREPLRICPGYHGVQHMDGAKADEFLGERSNNHLFLRLAVSLWLEHVMMDIQHAVRKVTKALHEAVRLDQSSRTGQLRSEGAASGRKK